MPWDSMGEHVLLVYKTLDSFPSTKQTTTVKYLSLGPQNRGHKVSQNGVDNPH